MAESYCRDHYLLIINIDEVIFKRVINARHAQEKQLFCESSEIRTSMELYPAIISKETFKVVELKKRHRSYVVKDENEVKRRESKYSFKNKSQNNLIKIKI